MSRISTRTPRRSTRVFIWATGGAAAVLVAVALPYLPQPAPLPLLVCVVLAVLAERLYLLQSQGAGGSVISPTLAVVFGALWLTGPAGALLCNCMAAVANAIFRRAYNLERMLINAASVALATLAAGGVGMALGLHPGQALGFAPLLAVGAALVAYFAANTGVIASVIAIDTRAGWWGTWRQHFLWLAPQELAMGLVGGVGAASFLAMGIPGLLGYSIPLLAVYYTLRLYVHKAEADLKETRELNTRLETTNEQLIEALAAIVDARDALLYGHSAQVALYAKTIGQEMGLTGNELERVRKGALLHDVGKVAVPEQILFKPGPLTDEEYRTIQHHAIVGERLVGLVDALRPLSVLVGQHHEAWDGGGYPRRLRGEEIELGARIINLCDALDTILSDRPYKQGRSLEWAVAEVKRCSGTQFDPALVEAFLRVLEREGDTLFVNSAHATAVGLRRSELFFVLRRLGLNVRGQAAEMLEKAGGG